MKPGAKIHEVSPPRRVPRPGQYVAEVRARHRPPALGAATIRAVLRHYGVEVDGPLAELPIGGRSDNVIVTTATGPVVVKRYPARAVYETILHEHSIARRLAAGGISVAPLRTRPDGATCCMVDGRYFAVTDLVEGVSLSGCYLPPGRVLRLFEAAGALLASFHDELEGFRPDGRHHLGSSVSQRVPGDATEHHLEALERLCRIDGGGADTERWLADRGAAIADAIRDLDRRLEHRELSIGVIHGDYGLHNLTFAPDGCPTVHDLELARIDPLLIDVVVMLSRSSRRRGRAFLEGYRSVRELDASDWDALPEIWQHYRLCGAVRSWENFREQGGRQRLVTARQRIEEAERVATHGVKAWE